MTRRTFMPRNEADKVTWIQNFSSKLATYKTKYGLTDSEVADMVAAALYYAFFANYLNQYNEYVKKLTQFRNEIRDGVASAASASVLPTPPNLGTPPPVPAPGVFKRASSIAAVIKSRSNFTEADGNDLGIIGVSASAPDLVNAKPQIEIRLVQGGKPEILWTKGEYDGLAIYVDRGTDAWSFLAIDTYPDYIDNFALPASGSAAVWRYRAIYRYDDIEVGMWSDIVSITVGG
jgi:hypothetical protein